MSYPGGCSSKSTVDTINTNVSNLAIAYAKQSVYPNCAAGKQAATPTTAWVLGSASSVLMTASSNTIVGIHVEQASANDTYQLNLYAAGDLCCSVVFSFKDVTAVDSIYIPTRSQKVTGAITAKLASGGGAGHTVVVKVVVV